MLHDKIHERANKGKSKEYRRLKAYEVPFHVPGPVSGTKLRKGRKELLKKLNDHKVLGKKGAEMVIVKMRPIRRPHQIKASQSSNLKKVHLAEHEDLFKKVSSKETEQEEDVNEEEDEDNKDGADSDQQQLDLVPPYQAPLFQNQPTPNPWVYNASNGWPSRNTTYVNYG